MPKTLPKVYYGLHMVEGVAEYAEPQVNDGQPYRILLLENCIKNMDASFEGRPVYVQHVDEVNLDTLQHEAAGYVVKSFFNQPDGKHWCKFIVVSDEGHNAIRSGWKLSNAYIPKEWAGGGKWHNVDYSKEVMRAEYEHLAIVPNPRYEESIILTPEEFKAYNSEKELELEKLANSKGESTMSALLKFFKKTKVENSADLESTTVQLRDGREMTIAQVVNSLEEMEKEKKNEEEAAAKPQMANGDHMVKIGNEEMTVNQLVEKHMEMVKKSAAEAPKDEEKKNVEEGEDKEALKKAKELAEHEEKEIEEKKENEEEKKEEKKENSNFDTLANAHLKALAPVADLSMDQVARGKTRYGSSK